jgi:type III pantothenate kinase
MKLLLDLGNTRLKAALARDDVALEPTAFAHATPEFESLFQAWLAQQVPPGAPCWLASVAPEAVLARVTSVLARHAFDVHRVRVDATRPEVRIAYADPQRLGVDRWLAMLAARARGGDAPVLVANVGSALTIDALLGDGTHLGGLISPPPEALRAALIARAPRLELAPGTVQRFARSSEDAVASGCLLPSAALVERSLAELAQQAGRAPRLLLGGGGAAPLRPWLPPHEFEPELALAGLACIVRAAP